jgi:excisionase family DNA binding protein
MLSLTRIGVHDAPVRVRFLLDKCHSRDILKMKTYSISDAADILEVNRRTLYRWIKNKVIPAPKPGEVKGRLARVWTESDLAAIRDYMKQSFWGKGIDRRTGKKAKPK